MTELEEIVIYGMVLHKIDEHGHKVHVPREQWDTKFKPKDEEMPADETQKWRSPTGSPIASDVTDANKDAYGGDVQAALEAQDDTFWIDKVKELWAAYMPKGHEDVMGVIERALAQQQADAELLGAANRLIDIVEGIKGSMEHGTWKDEKGLRLKDTREWVSLYNCCRAEQKQRPVMCHADRDGDCKHPDCPQLRDNEPSATGRHCPLDTEQKGGV